ncbi:piggyBac transposable element-derived protein 4-like [Vespula squamosa]|uniref:PiggyBac transposable element-derived protein 4-like n=1 Tax=Vespula squamosa TaxID=30214 RepID=A0ABD2BH81_VESSQ
MTTDLFYCKDPDNIDANSKHVINGFPYLGKDKKRDYLIPLEELVILKLMEPFTEYGRNVTISNIFTSISQLPIKLFAKRSTIVGTIEK